MSDLRFEGKYSIRTPVNYQKDGKEETFWQDVGIGFGKDTGISILLNALPVNGKLYLMPFRERDEEPRKGGKK